MNSIFSTSYSKLGKPARVDAQSERKLGERLGGFLSFYHRKTAVHERIE